MKKDNQATWNIVLLLLAMFFGTMEMTVVITALPTLGRVFPQAGDWLPWLTTGTLVAAAVAMPLGGKLADEWGIKRVFLVGLVLFSLGSLLAGLVGWVFPNSIGLLIGFRFLQGFGGGIFAPVGYKLISVLLKGGRRTQAMGFAGMVTPLAAVLGPNVGGILIDHFPWRVIFFFNAFAGLAIALLATIFMHEVLTARRKNALDIIGIVTFAGAILSALLAFTIARQSGFISPVTLSLLLVAGILATFLSRVEGRVPAPFLDPILLSGKGMGIILGYSFLQGLVMYGTLIYLTFFAQTHPSIMATPTQSGVLLTPGALAQMLAAPLVGRLISKVGYRMMVIAGMLLTAGSLLVMFVGPTSLGVLAAILALSRVGSVMASIPLAAAGLEVNVHAAGAISGLRQLFNVLGGVVGPVVLSLLFPLSPAGVSRLTGVFVLMGLLLLLALPAARGIPADEERAGKISRQYDGVQ